MIEDLQLRGMGALTQQRYVRAVQQLAEHYGKSPDKISEEELRDYFLYVKNVKKWSRSTSTIALCNHMTNLPKFFLIEQPVGQNGADPHGP